MTRKRNYYIDICRILFSLIIVYFHIFRSNLFILEDGSLLKKMHFTTTNAAQIVEFFFIVGGLFLYKECKTDNSIISHIYNKITRLWPVLFVSSLIESLFNGFNYNRLIIKSFFLQCIGLYSNFKGISWYVSSYFWAIVFFIVYNRVQKDENKRFLLYLIIAYVGYAININMTENFGRGVVLSIVDLSLFRALAGVATGHIIGYIVERINVKDISNKNIMFVRLLMYISWLYLIIIYLFNEILSYNPLVLIIMISVFVFSSEIISSVNNAPTFIQNTAKYSKYSYSIYLMQQSSFNIVKEILNYTNMNRSNMICVLIYFVVAIVIGVLTYHLIEVNGKNILSKYSGLLR